MHPYAFYCYFQIFSICGMSICHFFFSIGRKFSIGWRSGLLSGQSNVLIFFLRKSLINFERWQGAPFYLNIMHSRIVVWISSLSSKILQYLMLFIVVPIGKKKRPDVPLLDSGHRPRSWHWEDVLSVACP